ncbi:sensor histidine kinase [Dyadobacter crusticola]|uniref:sensor histidine kinase n=1 Tax=Dyadobacter crusticola TaxID=292407 RepID=UPI0004E14204|nr:ATP-binding protein [Dyadobacter crusticola]
MDRRFDQMKNLWLALWLVCLGALPVIAQSGGSGMREVGRPMSGFYQSSEYHAHDQNFGITQDSTGMMYFANFAGVLEFDGVSWTTIQTENVTRVSALTTDRKGRVLVGGNGEFGYLAYDSLGVHRFVSLSAKLKEKPGQVIQILPEKNGAWFVSDQINFFWDGRNVKSYKHGLSIQSAFPFGQGAVIYARNKGFMLLNDGKFSAVTTAQNVPALLDLVAVVPLADNSAMLLTTSQGAYLLKGNHVENIEGNANPVLISNKATSAVRMQNGKIAISMAANGMLIVNPDGNIAYPIFAYGDMEDSQVSAMFSDREHNLWLALNNGIARLDLPSPISVFDGTSGLKGSVTAVTRFGNKIIVGTLTGLHSIENNQVAHLTAFPGSCLGFSEAGGFLYVASNKGLFQLSKTGGLSTLSNDFSLAVTASADGNKLFVGLQDGLAVFKKTGSGWQKERIKSITEQITGITEFPTGTFWLETLSNGILKFDYTTGAARKFAAPQGISSPLYNKLAVFGNRLIVTNKDGLFEYHSNADRFTRADWLSEKVWFDRVQGDSEGNIWTTRGDKKSVNFFRKKGQSNAFELIEKPFLPIAAIPFQVIFPDQDGVAWLGGDQGLYRLDMRQGEQRRLIYPVLLRKVSTRDGGLPVYRDASRDRISLDHRQNSLIFEFALPSFHSNQEVAYQYLLENYDKGWSEWGTIARKEYSGLPSGSYVFKVRARDIYGNISGEATFPLLIRTPWFRQWYMIALYALVFAVMIYYAVRWRLRAILREKQELENLIRERTEEVVSQKEELEHQSEELSATNDQLERIDEFVKSINGEVNTGRLFQLVLDRLCEFQNVDGASALIYNKGTDCYQFIALAGVIESADVENVQLSAADAEQRYIVGAEEVYEDIFLKNNFRHQNTNRSVSERFSPKSLISILIRVDGDVKSYITLENMDRENAFGERDYNMVKNLKEHLIGAYIKTNILEDLENTLSNLKSTQEELIRQERLASVGSLTKGIVDRILNPLNYINNFSQSSGKLLKEITEVTDKHQDVLSEDEKDDLDSGFEMLQKNLEKIYEHGNSTTRIVKDMQKLLKGKSTEFIEVELNPFLESKSKAALQEVLAEYKEAKIKLVFALEAEPVRVSLLPYEFAQVLTNLISNACYAVMEKTKFDKVFEPEIRISSRREEGAVSVFVRDNGKGIPVKETEQLFNPFFTTKPTSKGTGLGLYMSKDIIEFHKGRMSVTSKEGDFTEIEISLPTVK